MGSKKATGYYGYIIYLTKDKETISKSFDGEEINKIMELIANLYDCEALILSFNITMRK